MANILIYSFDNPLQLFDPNPVTDDRYRSKDFIDFDFPDTILPWQQNTGFCQPWQKSDTIFLQLQTNIGPVSLILKDCETGYVIDTKLFTQKEESVTQPGLFIYELSMPLTDYPAGCYYAEITLGADPVVFTLRTGELEIAETHENSLYLEYKNYEFRNDIIWETGAFMAIRVFGTNKYLKTASKSTTYEDQVLNMTALRSTPYRIWRLIIGQSKGIPDWYQDKLGGIIGNSTLLIDGKPFTKPADNDLELIEDDRYPKRGWGVELRERYNRRSRTYENNIPLDALIALAVNVDSKGFGNSNSGSQTIVIDVN